MSRDDTIIPAPPDPHDDADQFYPQRSGMQNSRLLLGLLMLMLAAAVMLALWFLLVDDDGDSNGQAASPTPLTIPTSAPAPTAIPTPTTGPDPTPTAVPEGFEACGDSRAPIVGQSYLVNTNTTPLNQRTEPSVSGELVGSYPPATSGLKFTGDCLVNIADGYVWWQINTATTTVWVASDFLSPN